MVSPKLLKRKGSSANCASFLTFTVIAESHLGLAETNSVFASADAIELFELGLLNVLQVSNVNAMSCMAVLASLPATGSGCKHNTRVRVEEY